MLSEPKSNASLKFVTAFIVAVLISLLGYSYSGLHREEAPSSDAGVAASEKAKTTSDEKAATADSDAQEPASDSNMAPLPGSSAGDDGDAAEPVSDSSDSSDSEEASDSDAAAPGYGQ